MSLSQAAVLARSVLVKTQLGPEVVSTTFDLDAVTTTSSIEPASTVVNLTFAVLPKARYTSETFEAPEDTV